MLTDLSIKNLMRPADPDSRTETPDGKISGLYFVRQPSGAASWAVRYRAGGKPAEAHAWPLSCARSRRGPQAGEGGHRRDRQGRRPCRRQEGVQGRCKGEQAVEDRLDDVAPLFVEKHAKRKAGSLWAAETERLLRVEILLVPA